jgi:redox-sensitive bicupin YhaK (pirin superfamily)
MPPRRKLQKAPTTTDEHSLQADRGESNLTEELRGIAARAKAEYEAALATHDAADAHVVDIALAAVAHCEQTIALCDGRDKVVGGGAPAPVVGSSNAAAQPEMLADDDCPDWLLAAGENLQKLIISQRPKRTPKTW